MNTKFLSLAALAGLMASSCANDDVVMENSDPKGDAINFTASVGRPTRATEVKIDNLGSFGVYARTVENGIIGTTPVIGDEAPEIAKRSDKPNEATTWKLKKNIYWPLNAKNVLFWGFTSLLNETYKDANDKPVDVPLYDEATNTGGLCGSGKITFDSQTGPFLSKFTPKRAVHYTGEGAGKTFSEEYIDGSLQKDLVVAFTPADKPSSYIKLNFEHALSQVFIHAIGGQDQEARKVIVKGAWIVNVGSEANLSAAFQHNSGKYTCGHEWGNINTPVAYGSMFKNPIILDPAKEVSVLSPNNTGSLMVIPQSVPAWVGRQDGITFENAVVNDQAYIMLYCRIEMRHDLSDQNNTDDFVNSTPANDPNSNRHYHQLFPKTRNEKGDLIYDATKYGYTCVPVAIKWERGKKYKYTLNICTSETGGGVYPPILPPDAPEVPVPDDKVPGDPVLDAPISFSVSVSDWEQTWEEGKPGQIVDMD